MTKQKITVEREIQFSTTKDLQHMYKEFLKLPKRYLAIRIIKDMLRIDACDAQQAFALISYIAGCNINKTIEALGTINQIENRWGLKEKPTDKQCLFTNDSF